MKKESTMTDTFGREIPISYVPKYKKEQDKIVQRVRKAFETARKALEKCEAETREMFGKLEQLRQAEGQKSGDKGFAYATSFDGLTRIELRVAYNIQADPRVMTAREMMLSFIRGELATAKSESLQAILPLIDAAFKVSASGQLSNARIIDLLAVEIPAKPWQDARKILQDSLQMVRGKNYIRVSTKANHNADFVPIRLDIQSCINEEY